MGKRLGLQAAYHSTYGDEPQESDDFIVGQVDELDVFEHSEWQAFFADQQGGEQSEEFHLGLRVGIN